MADRLKKTEKLKKKKEKKGKKVGGEKKKSRWKRMFKKVRDKSRERFKKLSSQTVGLVFESWTQKHHLPQSAQHEAAMELQKQLEQYQQELKQRQQRVAQGTVEGQLREGDDTLPYEPQPLLMNFGQQATDESPSEEAEGRGGSSSLATESSESSSDRSEGSEKSNSSISADISDSSQSASTASASTSSSDSEKSINDKSGQLSNILLSILQDAQKDGSIRKEEEDILQLPPEKLAVLSRNQGDKFDKIIAENTKQGLFLSQPSGQEREAWSQYKARPRHPSLSVHQVTFTNDTSVDKKIFCHSCNPRHASYPYAKQAKRNT